MLRCAAHPEVGALGRLALPAQDKTADALARALAVHGHGTETAFGVEIAVGFGEAEPALGNVTDAAPASRYDAEDLADDLLRRLVALATDGTTALVLDLGASGLELAAAEIDAL